MKIEKIRRLREKMKETVEEVRGKDELLKDLVSLSSIKLKMNTMQNTYVLYLTIDNIFP